MSNALQELYRQTVRKQHLEAILEKLRQEQNKLKKQVWHLNLASVRERADVERLKKRSLVTFFYALTMQRGKMLAREEQEAYAAAVRHDAAAARLREVEEAISRYTAEVRELYGCEDRYQQCCAEAMTAAKAANTPQTEELLRLEEQAARLEAQQAEREEAMVAGKRTRELVRQLIRDLESAKAWSSADLFSSSIMTDINKFAQIEQVERLTEQLRTHLLRFRTELSDVRDAVLPEPIISGSMIAADFFADDIFTALTVRNSLEAMMQQVEPIEAQLDQALRRLEHACDEGEKQLRSCRERMAALIGQTAL